MRAKPEYPARRGSPGNRAGSRHNRHGRGLSVPRNRNMRRHLLLLPALLLCGLSASAAAAPPVTARPRTTVSRPRPVVRKLGSAATKRSLSPSRAVVGTKSGRASFDVAKLPVNAQQRLLQGGLDPAVLAAALDVLRQFAETGAGPLSKDQGRTARRPRRSWRASMGCPRPRVSRRSAPPAARARHRRCRRRSGTRRGRRWSDSARPPTHCPPRA